MVWYSIRQVRHVWHEESGPEKRLRKNGNMQPETI